MAARRVVSKSYDINTLGSPTDPIRGVESKAKNPGSSNRKSCSSLGQMMAPSHKRMSRMLGYCLTLNTADAWSDFCTVAASRLTDAERAALAFSALKSLRPDHSQATAAAALSAGHTPLPPFLGGMDEARFWAASATPSERKAIALAAFEAMSRTDQAAFFRHISEMEMAA